MEHGRVKQRGGLREVLTAYKGKDPWLDDSRAGQA
jgi:ABC-2 type transport system ATP-binding protein